MSDVAKWLRRETFDPSATEVTNKYHQALAEVCAKQNEALILALCCCETTNACWLHDESLDESMKQWTDEREIAKWGNARGAIKAAEALKERYE